MPGLAAGLHPDVMAAAVLAEAGWPVGPRPMTCVCGFERGRHRGPAEVLPGVCDGYIHDPVDQLALDAVESADRQVVDDITGHLDAAYQPSGRLGPRVSDFGGCPRKVWYREQPPAGYVPLPEDRRRATLGTVVHQAAQAARTARYPWRHYEFEVAIPGLDKPGRVDEYDPVLGEVTDNKTLGDFAWGRYGDDGPGDSAWGQVAIYGYALETAGYPVRSLRIIGINRDTGAEEHFHRPYDPAEAVAALDTLIEVATQLDLGIVPPRAGTGPGRFPCSYCPARVHCWNIAAADAAGRSPESYTLLGVEPDDPTIAWAAERAYHATKANTAAKAAHEEASALLDGIPAGTYGGWKVGPRSRVMPNWKATAERILALYPLPDEYRPPVEAVEKPDTRIDRWTAVTPVRAADRTPARRRKAKPQPEGTPE